jgi:dTDP-glucose 4,6-dehydratase
MRLLVTGGCGFIGSNFIRFMLGSYPEIEIINLDKLTYAGNPENLRDKERDPRYRFILGDICDPSVVEEAVRGSDAVLNFAAESHVDRSIVDSRAFVLTGVEGVRVLLDAARKAHVRKFLQVGTDEVYGSVRGFASEESPLNPSSPYSAVKAAGDLLALSYFKTYGFPVVVTRSSNNYGPFQYPEKLIPLFITNGIEGKIFPVYGNGKQVRDWIHVLDNCRAIDLVLRDGISGGIYNISGNNELRNIDITRTIIRELHVSDNMIRQVTDRPGHDFRYAIEDRKIKELGFYPSIPFRQGLKETVKWYETHADWWKPLKTGQGIRTT